MDSQPQDHRSFFPSTRHLRCQQLPSDANQLQRHQVHQLQQAQRMFPFDSLSSQSPQPPLGMGLPTAEQQQYLSQSQDPSSPITLDMLGDWLQMSAQGMDSNPSQDSSTASTSSSQAAAGEGNMTYNHPQLLLDHQFRLTQLQQLQQLQQQIFQQQIALISGHPPSLLNNSGSSTFELQRDQTFTFNGLPTPASSGELRPQQQSLDFISPMFLNAFAESTSQPPRDLNTHQSLPNSPTLHSAPESVMNSPAFLGTNSGQLQNFSSTPYIPPGSVSAPEYIAFQTSPSHNGPSPPADLDLDISPLTSPWLGAQPISQQQAVSYQNQGRNRSQSRRRPSTARSSPPPPSSQAGPPYPTTPLTGPTINSNNKRSASPASATTDARKKHSPAVRPTYPITTFSHQHPDHQQQQQQQQQQPPPARRSHRAGSRSASSTPHILGRPAPSRQRKGSVAGPTITEAPGDSPSPVDLSMPPPAPPLPSNPALISPTAARFPTSPAINPLQQGNNGTPPHLTPVTPASIMNLDVKGKRLKIVTDSHPTGAASNSGSAGTGTSASASASASPVSTRSKRGVQGGINGGTPLISPSLKPILPGPSTVSPLLPMTPISYTNGSHQHQHHPSSTSSSSAAPAPSAGASSSASASSASMSMLPPQVRKTSHKAAEQKRRDSLKTTFDELRGLLPPIPLPSASAAGSGGALGSAVGGDEDGVSNSNSNNNVPGGGGGPSSSSGGVAGTTNTNTNTTNTNTAGIIFGGAVKPLLPGALPPRGPPKAGGEGPNKSVSKLQLLICGNEFIRTLKARVDRRDDEIARLRGEVRKLRHLLGVISGVESPNSSSGAGGDGFGGGGGAAGGAESSTMMGVESLMAQLDLDLDLDRDLDAVEKMVGHSVGINGMSSSGGRRDDIMSSARSDITMDEDVDDDEE